MSTWVKRDLDSTTTKLMDIRSDVNPDVWASAIRSQLGRIEEASAAVAERWKTGGVEMADFEPTRRLRYDSHFLVVAIAHVLKVHVVCTGLTGDARLVEARRQFDAAVPHAKDFRDMLEHIDAYALGVGNLQRDGKVDARVTFQTVTLLSNTSRVMLHFGKHELDVQDAARAALELAAETSTVYWEHVNRGLDKWTAPHS